MAWDLVGKKKIVTGWLRWRVKEVLTPSKCSKCRRVGHEGKSCNEELPVGCYNCGGSDHKAKECKNTPRCYLCKEEGHRMETLVCPIYKQMIGGMKGLNALWRDREEESLPT